MLPAATTHDKEVINFLIAPRFLLDFAADPNMAGLAASAVTIGRSLLAYVKHKCMEKMCCEVQKLREEGNLENGIIVESAPQRAQMMHTPRIKDKPSLHKVVEEVLDFLKESDIRRIGIWGLAGIGKTTIMQNLNNNDDITNFFDVVIWVTVSKERSMENIQHAVLERLKLNVEGIFSTDKVASRILEELESKRYLLLLDEVWDVIDLNALGLCVMRRIARIEPLASSPGVCWFATLDRQSSKDLPKEGQHTPLEGWIEELAKLAYNKHTRGNMELATIPESFFGSMCKLQVLDLHGTRIVSLPSSVSSLTCLRALYLNACIHLMELPSEIVQLQHLQVLDMRNTSINNLTSEIGSLVSLRCLRVSFNNVGSINHSRREMIHDRVISSLSKLEELSIDVNSSNQFWDEIADAVTEEVATLTQLTALRFYFPRVDCIYHAISEVLTEADAFELIGHKDVQRLSDFGTGSMDRMRGCLIEGCKEIETIIRGDQVTDSATLRQLEKLYMINLPKLRSIWEGPSQSGSFAHLTNLTMDQCQSLKKIFSKGMIQQLSELQYLSVEDCSEIEEIIIDAEDDILESDALPKLKTLILLNLPILESICKDEWLDWPSLETIKTSRCELLKTLPFSMDNAAKLRVIEGQEEWWTALDWKDMAVEQRLKSLCLFF
ncbi:hypothetical protein HHK36_032263 [Tetracentron sinense]|uniref:Uncharacterized protein n=1 Tax=Tetracentron sinense TaxID=13715 RepID=A0A834Y5T5_TETSI|nr:hypothetical protein HHK36_032263 [Tetracentron sinense]